jgi:hypothetical protein
MTTTNRPPANVVSTARAVAGREIVDGVVAGTYVHPLAEGVMLAEGATAIDVVCPFCPALAGERCKLPDGDPYRGGRLVASMHDSRARSFVGLGGILPPRVKKGATS